MSYSSAQKTKTNTITKRTALIWNRLQTLTSKSTCYKSEAPLTAMICPTWKRHQAVSRSTFTRMATRLLLVASRAAPSIELNYKVI